MDVLIVTVLICLFLALLALRAFCISCFKIGYYEQKLRNRDVDISDIENIGIIGIFKL